MDSIYSKAKKALEKEEYSRVKAEYAMLTKIPISDEWAYLYDNDEKAKPELIINNIFERPISHRFVLSNPMIFKHDDILNYLKHVDSNLSILELNLLCKNSEFDENCVAVIITRISDKQYGNLAYKTIMCVMKQLSDGVLQRYVEKFDDEANKMGCFIANCMLKHNSENCVGDNFDYNELISTLTKSEIKPKPKICTIIEPKITDLKTNITNKINAYCKGETAIGKTEQSAIKRLHSHALRHGSVNMSLEQFIDVMPIMIQPVIVVKSSFCINEEHIKNRTTCVNGNIVPYSHNIERNERQRYIEKLAHEVGIL